MATQLDKPAEAASKEAAWYEGANDMLASKLPDAVKGFGFARPGGNKPLDDDADIFDRSFKAATALKGAVRKSHTDPNSVIKGLNPSFTNQFGLFNSAMGAPGFAGGGQGMNEFVQQVQGALGELGKNITIGSGPLYSSSFGTAGFVPYDLVAPARLVYPVFSPLRNKLPRVPGQGTARQAKIVTGVSGSQTGGQGVVDISYAETTTFTSFANTPPAGAQTAVNISVPYRFMALSESLSWLAQFSGQGFEDISALANLILLQEFMLGEEYAIIAGTSSNLAAPATPTATLRTAGSNETGLPSSSHFWVAVSATNYWGETVMSTVTADLSTVATTQVIDVTIPAVSGALSYNIYVNNQAASTPARTAMWRFASGVGGVKFTIQGPTIPNSVVANPPAADSGTGGANRIEGLVPTLSGFSATTAGIYPTTGSNSTQWQGGYVNQAAGTHLSINLLNTAFQQMWDGGGSNNPGSFRADPSEIIGEGGDIMRLSNDVVQSGAATNYRLAIEQPDVSGIRAGAAVSEFQNPITRSVVKLLVHPWLTQGTAMLMSYTVPYSWSQVSNTWEMTMVQDYLSISWPVIDPTFRYSMFAYGGLVANAPWYSGLIQGLQKSDVTPYS